MKKTAKQIVALLGVILLVMLYVLSLVFAIFDFEGSDLMLRSCLYATLIIPILIWAYMYLYDKLKKNRDGSEDRTTYHK